MFVPCLGAGDDPALRTLLATEPGASSQAPLGSLYAALQALTRYPGHWAIVVTYAARSSAGAVVADLRAGRRPVPSGGRWDFRAHIAPSRESDLYALFTGEALEDGARPDGWPTCRVPYGPVEPLRGRLQALAHNGIDLRSVADSTKVPLVTLARLARPGGRSRVRKDTADRVLGPVTAGPVTPRT